MTYWLLGENKQKRLTRLESIYSDNPNAFLNTGRNSETDAGISFNAARDNSGYSSTEFIPDSQTQVKNNTNVTYDPVRHQSETFSESDFVSDFTDTHIMHSTDANYEETTDTESTHDSIICNGGKETADSRKRKNGNIISRFEMTPLLDNDSQVV